MPKAPRLPIPNRRSDSIGRGWIHSGPVPLRPPRRRTYRLPLHEVMPQLHIAHRLLGEVGVAYRIIHDHELIAVLVGQGDLYLDGRRHAVKAPCLIRIPPWVPHVLLTSTGRRGQHMAFHYDLAPGVPDRMQPGVVREPYSVEVIDAPDLPAVLPLDDAMLARLIATLEAWRARDVLAPLRAARAMQGVLLSLWSHADGTRHAKADGADAAMIKALRCIAERHAEPLSIDDLARAAELGRSRFAERFRLWTGRSPAAFLRRYRIDRACSLLVQGQVLGAIAPAVGYGDAFALSKAFRAELGCSPRQWRAAQATGVSDMF